MKRYFIAACLLILALIGREEVMAAIILPYETIAPTQGPIETIVPAIGGNCSSDSDCGWCGSVCKIGAAKAMCPDILPPEGEECKCAAGSCKGVVTGGGACPTIPPGCTSHTVTCKVAPCCPVADCTSPTITAVPTAGISCRWCDGQCLNSEIEKSCASEEPPAGKLCVAENGGCVTKEQNGSCGSCPAGVPLKSDGNADCDNEIGLADFALWKIEYIKNIGGEKRTGWSTDFGCDGKVDLDDFALWKISYIKSLNNILEQDQ